MVDEEQKSIFNLQIDPAGEAALAESAKWGRFLSILGFIVCGLIVLSMLSVLLIGATATLGAGSTGLTVLVVYLVMAALYFIPCLHLYNYSRYVGAAIASSNQEAVTDAFSKLKSFFKFLGIMAIVGIVMMIAGVIYIVLILGMGGV